MIKLINFVILISVVALLGCGHVALRDQLSEEFENSKNTSKISSVQFNDLCLAGLNAACALLGAPPNFSAHLPVAQGYTDKNTTYLSVLVPKGQLFEYLLLVEFNGERKVVERIAQASHSIAPKGARDDWSLDSVTLTNLEEGKLYQLWIINQAGNIVDRRSLKTLDLDKSSADVAVASCTDDENPNQAAAWESLLQQHPDLVILIGDNVYADRPAPATVTTLWNRYFKTRETLSVFQREQLVPIIAVWDDHDYGQNDGDMEFGSQAESKRLLELFFPKPSLPTGHWSPGPGVAQSLVAFGQKFILLDDRSFRTPNRIVRNDQSHLGTLQVRWLKTELGESSNRMAWIMEGDQFFGDYHNFESFAGSHPDDFQNFVRDLKSIHSRFVLVSGDRHMAEVMSLSKKDIGQKTWEFTTSGLHAKTFEDALARNPNPRRKWGASGPLNFMTIRVRDSKGLESVEARFYGVKEGLLYKQKVYSRNRSKKLKN